MKRFRFLGHYNGHWWWQSVADDAGTFTYVRIRNFFGRTPEILTWTNAFDELRYRDARR